MHLDVLLHILHLRLLDVLARRRLLCVPHIVRLLLLLPLFVFQVILVTTWLGLSSKGLLILMVRIACLLELLVITLPKGSRRGLTIAGIVV